MFKKDKLKIIYLLLLIFIFPYMVYADDGLPYEFGVLMGLFISIHLSLFFLIPLTKKINPDNKLLPIFVIIGRIIYVLVMNSLFGLFAVFDFILCWLACFIGGIFLGTMTVNNTNSNSNINSNLTPENGKKICTKCNLEFPINANNCSNCGGLLTLVNTSNVVSNNNTLSSNAAAGTPVNKNDYNPIFFSFSKDQLIMSFIEKELSKDSTNSSKTLSSVELRKTIMTFIYSVLIFLFIVIYVSYHTNIFILLLLFIVLTIIYLVLVLGYGVKKYLVKEVTSRPDEKIEYVVQSTMSSATNNKFTYVLIRLIILIAFISIPIYLFREPHLIYEMDNDNGGYAVRYYTLGILKPDTELEIPSKYNNKPVVSIRGDVFENVYTLEKVTLPDTIVEIRGGAFQGCSSLEEINLPPKIKEVKGSTFENCYNLTSINIPEGVTRIGGSAFRQCSNLREVVIPKTVTEIGSSAFRGTALSKVCISNTAYVNERAFKETSAFITYYENGCENNYYSGDDYNYGYNYGNS